MLTWWQSLPWSAALMVCCYLGVLLIGLYLLYDNRRRRKQELLPPPSDKCKRNSTEAVP